jgi:hypothetical protein
MSRVVAMDLAFRFDVGWDLRYLIGRVTGRPVHVAVCYTYADGRVDWIEATFTGVRARFFSTPRPGQWTFVRVPVSPDDALRSYVWAQTLIGRGYDWLGVLWAWWGGRAAGDGLRDRFFCSELAVEALFEAGVDLQPRRPAAFTPRRLWEATKPWH